jgi:uncharacterized protein (TIGR02145 family)
MKKLSGILFVLVAFAFSATAQVDQLSTQGDRPEQKPALPKQPQDIKLNSPLKVVLKVDGTWELEKEKFTIVTAPDGKKYVLFANGFWSPMETVKDIDGNSYDALKLGKYFWTIQNLRTTKYNDGKPITLAPTDNEVWKGAAGAYTNVEDKAENKNTQGLLYSWAAANNANLCPKGWRVPTEAEWLDLLNHVGGLATAGAKLKSTDGWKAPEGVTKSVQGNDEFMFNAFPTGYRQMHADKRSFWQIGGEATFWTKTSKTDKQAISVIFNAHDAVLNRPFPKEFGRSIRCVKD